MYTWFVTRPLVDNTTVWIMRSREKSKRLWFCSLRWRRRHGQPEAEDSIRRLPIPRLVIVIYALCGRSTSGSTRTRSKCSGPPGLVEPHGHCTSYNTACHAYTQRTCTRLRPGSLAHSHVDELALILASSREGVYVML